MIEVKTLEVWFLQSKNSPFLSWFRKKNKIHQYCKIIFLETRFTTLLCIIILFVLLNLRTRKLNDELLNSNTEIIINDQINEID